MCRNLFGGGVVGFVLFVSMFIALCRSLLRYLCGGLVVGVAKHVVNNTNNIKRERTTQRRK